MASRPTASAQATTRGTRTARTRKVDRVLPFYQGLLRAEEAEKNWRAGKPDVANACAFLHESELGLAATHQSWQQDQNQSIEQQRNHQRRRVAESQVFKYKF